MSTAPLYIHSTPLHAQHPFYNNPFIWPMFLINLLRRLPFFAYIFGNSPCQFPAGSALRIHKINTLSRLDDIEIYINTFRDVNSEEKKSLKITLWREDADGKKLAQHVLTPEFKSGSIIAAKIKKSSLADGGSYRWDFDSNSKVCEYAVRWEYTNGELGAKHIIENFKIHRRIALVTGLYAIFWLLLLIFAQCLRAYKSNTKWGLEDLNHLIRQMRPD